jgi:hypothetical protein
MTHSLAAFGRIGTGCRPRTASHKFREGKDGEPFQPKAGNVEPKRVPVPR